jgi:hypothetical protein
MLNYSEDPKTIGLYPDELLEEDLTPDCSGYEAQCNEILEATKGKIVQFGNEWIFSKRPLPF